MRSETKKETRRTYNKLQEWGEDMSYEGEKNEFN